MKISELICVLNKRLQKHGDVEVEITWESISSNIDASSVYLKRGGVLYLDGDGNSYKDEFAVDPLEGNDGC